ncbi:nucleotide sugar dehydrogenase [Candidatus Pelagibacter sp.]|nr:nucleotide sugar dehydrogenase [Candidatus Pelagibacter sp.]
MKKKICVIGLGYVGLAMSVLCSIIKSKKSYKYNVYGFEKKDINGERIINALNNRKLPFKVDDNKFKINLFKILKKKLFQYGFNKEEFSTADIIILSINFDVDLKNKKINFNNLKKIIKDIAKRINPKCHILVESTLPPGTTEMVIYPEIKKIFKKRKIPESKIRLSYSFERVTPGKNYLNSIKNMHRVLGSIDKTSEKEMSKFLRSILNKKTAKICILNNTTEAEACKILENTYRAVNIAFIEEWRNYSSLLGLNINKILEYIRLRPTHNNIMKPGISVGGYCLTKDPLFAEISLKKIFKKKIKFPLSDKAVKINAQMTKNVLSDINKFYKLSSFKNKNVAIFGAAYRQGVGDTRYSPSSFVYDYFKRLGAKITVIDPYLDFWKEKNVIVNKKYQPKINTHLAIFLAPHRQFNSMQMKFNYNCLVIDANNVFSEKKIKEIKNNYKNNYIIGRYN